MVLQKESLEVALNAALLTHSSTESALCVSEVREVGPKLMVLCEFFRIFDGMVLFLLLYSQHSLVFQWHRPEIRKECGFVCATFFQQTKVRKQMGECPMADVVIEPALWWGRSMLIGFLDASGLIRTNSAH